MRVEIDEPGDRGVPAHVDCPCRHLLPSALDERDRVPLDGDDHIVEHPRPVPEVSECHDDAVLLNRGRQQASSDDEEEEECRWHDAETTS